MPLYTMLKVSWKALVSIKSIVKLIELILALLGFTLTATFDTETTVSCLTFDQSNYTIVYKTDFPFDYLDSNYEANSSDDLSRIEFDRDYGAMAKSFLAWGVITLIYCIMAVLAYMMLDENQEWKHYEKIATIIYLADFGGSVLWSVLWLVVSVVWTVGSIQLKDFIKDHSVCAQNATLHSRDDANFAQTYFAIGFAYTLVILWTLSIWWTLKSTLVYQSIVNGKRGGYEQIQ